VIDNFRQVSAYQSSLAMRLCSRALALFRPRQPIHKH
jgi:hypothetical protein